MAVRAKRKPRRKLKRRVTTQHLVTALRARYADREWVFMPQVRDGVGLGAHRTADALAMNTWASRGLELHGFELKVSRSDWLTELRDPSKAEEICRFCDRWWLVVGERGIVAEDELPPTWGLLVMRGQHLACERAAPKLTAKPWDRCFMASLLRRASASERPGAEVYRSAQDQAYSRGRDDYKREMGFNLKLAREGRERVEKHVAEFEQASGLSIGGWSAGDVGEAVKLITTQRGSSLDRHVASLRRTAVDVRTFADGFAQLADLLEHTRLDSQ